MYLHNIDVRVHIFVLFQFGDLCLVAKYRITMITEIMGGYHKYEMMRKNKNLTTLCKYAQRVGYIAYLS